MILLAPHGRVPIREERPLCRRHGEVSGVHGDGPADPVEAFGEYALRSDKRIQTTALHGLAESEATSLMARGDAPKHRHGTALAIFSGRSACFAGWGCKPRWFSPEGGSQSVCQAGSWRST